MVARPASDTKIRHFRIAISSLGTSERFEMAGPDRRSPFNPGSRFLRVLFCHQLLISVRRTPQYRVRPGEAQNLRHPENCGNSFLISSYSTATLWLHIDSMVL